MENENNNFVPEQPIAEQEMTAEPVIKQEAAAFAEPAFAQPEYGYQQPVAAPAKPPVILLPVFYIVASVASGVVAAVPNALIHILYTYTYTGSYLSGNWNEVIQYIFNLIGAVAFLVLAFVGIKVYNSKCKGLNMPEKTMPVYYVALYYLPGVFSHLVSSVLYIIAHVVIALFELSSYGMAYYVLISAPGTIASIFGVVCAFLIFNWVFKIREKNGN